MNNFFKASIIENITDENDDNYYKIHLKFAGFDELKSAIDQTTLSYQENLKQKLSLNHPLDAFYLAEFLFDQTKSDDLINLFKNNQIHNDMISSDILNYLGFASNNNRNCDEAINYYKKSLDIKIKLL
jgi:hypothetical protein